MNIAVLVSGGVDSSVALRLVLEQGYQATAFYLKIWLEDELSYLGTCPWEEDLAYVRAVCAQANVPLEVISLQREYWDLVVRYTLDQVKAGFTPNPDIMCNHHIKFGAFAEKLGNNFNYIATGHYARVVHKNNTSLLYRAPDALKDQTYFLAHLTQKQLNKALFPLGIYTKEQVRALAQKYDLPNKDRKDSQGICFLGKVHFSEFLRYHLGEKTGALIEYETGQEMGTHKGFWYYTIGQRQGLGLSGGPWYVVSKNSEKNQVFISRHYYSLDKPRNLLWAEQVRGIPVLPELPARLQVKLRHGPQLLDATVTPVEENKIQVLLDERDQGIAPGQFVVLYQGEQCVGSGMISLAP